jgi:hypothetical protein
VVSGVGTLRDFVICLLVGFAATLFVYELGPHPATACADHGVVSRLFFSCDLDDASRIQSDQLLLRKRRDDPYTTSLRNE